MACATCAGSCSRCGAAQGLPCRTGTGYRATTHTDRITAAGIEMVNIAELEWP